jgi:uncharacterized protein YjbI with pentapeptide repeats
MRAAPWAAVHTRQQFRTRRARMADAEHVARLRQGVEAWNAWRRTNPAITPDLADANLMEAYLIEADLRGADLGGADLRKANLFGANGSYGR